MVNPSSGSKKKIFLLFLVIAIGAAGGILLYFNRCGGFGSCESTPPPASPAVAATPSADDGDRVLTPATIPATATETPRRDAVILFDNVTVHEKAFEPTSKVMATLTSGDAVVALDEKTPPGNANPESRWYLIEAGGQNGYVPQDKILVFNEHSLFEQFSASTGPVREMMGRDAFSSAPTEEKKVAILDSPEFVLRCFANPDAEIKRRASMRLLYTVGPDDRLAAWFKLLQDNSNLDLHGVGYELGQLGMQTRLAGNPGPEFQKAYGALNAQKRVRLFQETCPGVLIDPGIFDVALALAAKDKDTAVFGAFLGCIEEELKGYKTQTFKQEKYPAVVALIEKKGFGKNLSATQKKAFMARLK